MLWRGTKVMNRGLGVERTLHTDICNKSLTRRVSYKEVDNENIPTRFALGLSR